ncbi:hypothetical protein Pmani_025903 [Petrolisthes manimaculis]|uniref:Uncharacterized protein n=1 Tax=Petrolisthes manimaculis TaxID=1843537 RepID=A0AAE1TXY1_9EUCA|nr:hypothetical protein Pmani_025903 [Petrolisthes manimaculis]
MVRVSLRRGVVYLSAAAATCLLLVSVHQPGTVWLPVTPPPHPSLLHRQQQQQQQQVPPPHQPPPHPPPHPPEDPPDLDPPQSPPSPLTRLEDDPLDSDTQPRPLPPILRPRPLPNVSLATVPPSQRPWYLKGGELMPESPAEGEGWTRGLDLWPDEDPDDRIENQLMFVPPPPPPMEDHPDPAEDRAPPQLKKILMYNGMNSWGTEGRKGSVPQAQMSRGYLRPHW